MLTFQTDFQSERIAVDEDQRVVFNDTYRHLLMRLLYNIFV